MTRLPDQIDAPMTPRQLATLRTLSAEAYQLMQEALGLSNDEMSAIFDEWNGGKLEIASTPNQDNPTMGKAVAGCEGKAILGVDVWEHAYYLKYQNKRAESVKGWGKVVNGTEVSRLFAAAK